jgi:multiple sugar transport system permease protein
MFGSRRVWPYLMIAPALALTLWIVGYPIIQIVEMASHSVNRFAQIGRYVGWRNFEDLPGDPIFLGSLWRTLLWTVIVVGVTTVLAFPVAIMLSDDFGGRSLARVIIMLPWAISVAMTAIVWRWALNGQYGLVNAMLYRAGLLHTPTEWLATATGALPIAMGIGVIVSLPFTITIFLGGLSSLPGDIFEAAKLDGASALARTRYLTLPLMWPFFNLSIILNVIYTFNSFSIIWVLTQGEPANSTDILVTYLYKLGFRYGRLAEAAAMTIIMLAVLLIFSVAYGSLTSERRMLTRRAA